MQAMKFTLSSMASVVILAFLLSQIPISSALTEEERLRAAITNPAVTSFKLTSNIVLTSDLPPFTITSGKARSFKVFSSSGFSISGARRYRGFRTVNAITTSFVYPKFALTFDKVKLQNFYLAEPFNDPNGAAISAVDTSLTILNSEISGCTAERGYGGAVYVSGTRKKALVIKKTTFSGNTALGGGAVSFETSAAALTIENSVFVGNEATGATPYGGAIYIGTFTSDPPTIKVTGTSFLSNRAGFGGAVSVLLDYQRLKQKPLVFSSCYFENNIGTDNESGGAFHLTNVKEIQLTRTTYNGNYAGDGTIPSVIFVRRWEGTLVTRIKIVSGPFPVVLSNDPASYVVV